MTVISGTERGGGSEGERDLETNAQRYREKDKERQREGWMGDRSQ